MSTATLEPNAGTILARVMTADQPTLSPAVASEFLSWGFSDADRTRMSELAAKAREGTLTDAERMEADEFERVNSFLGLVKSKARRSLQTRSV